MRKPIRQCARAIQLLKKEGMVRLHEFRNAGVAATTVCRLVEDGRVMRLERGLYQLSDAQLEPTHRLAMAAKIVPRGVFCLESALSYHGVSDQPYDWLRMAIGANDWTPKPDSLQIRYIRFAERYLTDDVEIRVIEGVPVRVFSVAKTIVDCFEHSRVVGSHAVLDWLVLAIEQRKATPAKIAEHALHRGIFNTIRPYIEAIVANENR